jgi:hypothetical protein
VTRPHLAVGLREGHDGEDVLVVRELELALPKQTASLAAASALSVCAAPVFLVQDERLTEARGSIPHPLALALSGDPSPKSFVVDKSTYRGLHGDGDLGEAALGGRDGLDVLLHQQHLPKPHHVSLRSASTLGANDWVRHSMDTKHHGCCRIQSR